MYEPDSRPSLTRSSSPPDAPQSRPPLRRPSAGLADGTCGLVQPPPRGQDSAARSANDDAATHREALLHELRQACRSYHLRHGPLAAGAGLLPFDHRTPTFNSMAFGPIVVQPIDVPGGGFALSLYFTKVGHSVGRPCPLQLQLAPLYMALCSRLCSQRLAHQLSHHHKFPSCALMGIDCIECHSAHLTCPSQEHMYLSMHTTHPCPGHFPCAHAVI